MVLEPPTVIRHSAFAPLLPPAAGPGKVARNLQKRLHSSYRWAATGSGLAGREAAILNHSDAMHHALFRKVVTGGVVQRTAVVPDSHCAG